jgi:hypothetical protein
MLSQNQSLSNNAAASSNLNYIQNQLTNPLFASQNLANLANLNTLNSLNNFNNLSSLLVNQQQQQQPSTTNNQLTATAGLPMNSLSDSLASSLFAAGLSNAVGSTFNQSTTNPLQQATATQSLLSLNQLDPFAMPQQSIEKSSSSSNTKTKKKQTAKEKDSNNSANTLKISNQANNLNRSNSMQNDSSFSKLNQLIPPSYLQFLPPSLAALSTPQSNWCAKCNIGFRMTSDLVYHMRSIHNSKDSNSNGNGQASPTKRKREENKLFCTICGEGFKERHHLTRHMISH